MEDARCLSCLKKGRKLVFLNFMNVDLQKLYLGSYC
jgi:hypothetical protein